MESSFRDRASVCVLATSVLLAIAFYAYRNCADRATLLVAGLLFVYTLFKSSDAIGLLAASFWSVFFASSILGPRYREFATWTWYSLLGLQMLVALIAYF